MRKRLIVADWIQRLEDADGAFDNALGDGIKALLFAEDFNVFCDPRMKGIVLPAIFASMLADKRGKIREIMPLRPGNTV